MINNVLVSVYSKVVVIYISSVQLLSHVQLLVTPWTAARQAFLSITSSRSLLKLMSIELVMPSNHLILCHPLLLLPSIFPSIRVFSNESVFVSGGQSFGVSGSSSDVYIHVSILFQFRLLQSIEQSSLSYTVGPCLLSNLNIALCICQAQTVKLSLLHTLSL